MCRNLLSILIVLAVTVSASAAPLYYDTFADGALDTNPDQGNGVHDWKFGHVNSELAGESKAYVNKDNSGDWWSSVIASKAEDDLNWWDSEGMTYRFRLGETVIDNDESDSPDVRMVMCLIDEARNHSQSHGAWGNDGYGALYLTVEIDAAGTAIGSLAVTDDTKQGSQSPPALANFTFDSFTGIGDGAWLETLIWVSDSGYAIEFAEDVTVTQGSLVGSWDSAIDTEFSDGAFWAVEVANHHEGRGYIHVDEVEVSDGNVIPEPATMALLGLGGLGALLRRKR
jgi:hypothetical protein